MARSTRYLRVAFRWTYCGQLLSLVVGLTFILEAPWGCQEALTRVGIVAVATRAPGWWAEYEDSVTECAWKIDRLGPLDVFSLTSGTERLMLP
jgi:hypothetical protein